MIERITSLASGVLRFFLPGQEADHVTEGKGKEIHRDRTFGGKNWRTGFNRMKIDQDDAPRGYWM